MYTVVDKIAHSMGATLKSLIGRSDLRQTVPRERAGEWGVGTATLDDILQELQKPGLDPRQEFEAWDFDPNVRSIDDLAEGQILNAVVTNVTDFGAFVDVGVHQDGLIHISQLADSFVNRPMDVIKAGQKIKVKVLAVDKPRKRISLTRRGL